eukprot:403349366
MNLLANLPSTNQNNQEIDYIEVNNEPKKRRSERIKLLKVTKTTKQNNMISSDRQVDRQIQRQILQELKQQIMEVRVEQQQIAFRKMPKQIPITAIFKAIKRQSNASKCNNKNDKDSRMIDESFNVFPPSNCLDSNSQIQCEESDMENAEMQEDFFSGYDSNSCSIRFGILSKRKFRDFEYSKPSKPKHLQQQNGQFQEQQSKKREVKCQLKTASAENSTISTAATMVE